MTRKTAEYRLAIAIHPEALAGPNAPVSVPLDFGALLPGESVRPETLTVWLGDRKIPHRLSHGFAYGHVGEVFFVVEDPSDLNFRITFETGTRKRAGVPSYLPPIGLGDPLHHNPPNPLPLATFGTPQIHDLNGDGCLHLTDAIYWSSYYGWPHNVILHRLRVEGAEGLEFGPVSAIRARKGPGTRPEIISEDFYIRHHIVDWDQDGRLDLVTVNSGARHARFYRNTGELEPSGCPLFELAIDYPLEGATGYLGVRLVGLFGDGRLHLAVGGDEHLPGHEKEPYTSYLQIYPNLADPGDSPGFGPPERLKLEDGQDLRHPGTGWNFTFADLDNDGRPDLLLTRSVEPDTVLWYRNTGNPGAGEGIPRFRLEGPPAEMQILPGREVTLGWGVCGEHQGPILNGVQYRLGIDLKRAAPYLHSPTPIVTANPELNGGDQPGPHPCDWDGDGDLDLLAGIGEGHVQFWANTGTRKLPVFSPRIFIPADGREIRIWRDQVFGGRHWHGMMGYTQPVFADWDGDGLPDLIVANETNRIFWFRNMGTRDGPVFGDMRQLEVEGFEETPEKREKSRLRALGDSPYPFEAEEAFWWRQKASVVDWNGDGLPDLVAVDGEGYFCLFERFKTPNGNLGLRKALRFLYKDGTHVTHGSLPREVSGVDGIVVCDWRNRGVWDILVGTCYTIFYLENQGDNAHPVFAPPVRLKLWGKEIRHSRHGLLGHAVDWDGDGRLSWVSGSESGMLLLFRRAALDADAPPRVVFGTLERC